MCAGVMKSPHGLLQQVKLPILSYTHGQLDHLTLKLTVQHLLQFGLVQIHNA
jgi:hypothetical protein